MFHQNNRRRAGFTLIELAIVLGVAGILFGGLWRLLSSSNQQTRDQAAANQISQLIAGVSAYLQSADQITDGLFSGLAGGGSQTLSFTLCDATHHVCNYLPPGFSAATTNSYGQTYSVAVLKDNTGAGSQPVSYSFMILTSGGETISETSGGRIAAMIGGDGGFVYTNQVCSPTAATAPNWACGAYGGWSVKTVDYANLATTVGHIATRTYYSSTQNASDLWLARKYKMGDTSPYKDLAKSGYSGLASPTYNTMTTPLFLGLNTNLAGQVPSNVFFLGGKSDPAATGGGTIYVQGGAIDLGTITAGGVNYTSTVSGIGGSLNPAVTLYGNMSSASGGNMLIKLTQAGSNCTKIVGGAPGNSLVEDDSCQDMFYAAGDATVRGELTVYNLYAQSFIYGTVKNWSDMRLKKDINPLSKSLEDIMKLKPVSFTFKSNGIKSMGVIAQDLEKIYPQLVSNDLKGFKSVDYDALIGPLIESVQELKKENDELRTQLRDQAAQQEKMEQSLQSLQQK